MNITVDRKNDACEADHAVDRALRASVATGDTEVLGILYDRHAKPLLGLAIAVLGNARDAEDLVHDVFMQLWQNTGTYDPQKGTLSYWLQMRLRSRAIDRHRSLATQLKYQQSHYHLESAEQTDAAPNLEHLIVVEYLTMLSATQRQVVQMMYWKGFTCQEIAAVLKVPIGTIKSRLAAALRILRKEFMSSEDNEIE